MYRKNHTKLLMVVHFVQGVEFTVHMELIGTHGVQG